MPLDLPSGAACFIDSNILYYALVHTPGVSEVCATLVDRIIAGEVQAISSVAVLADVVHKVMMYEAAVKSARPRSGIVGWLKHHPEALGRCSQYLAAAGRLTTLPLRLLAVDATFLIEAATISAAHQLLTGDALLVALMKRHGIVHLATNDDDFDRVPGITIWKPRS